MKNTDRRQEKIVLPTFLAFMLVLVGAVAALIFAAAQTDDLALAKERQIAIKAVHHTAAKMRHDISSVAVWDDSVVHIQNRYDPQWVEEYIGGWLHEFTNHQYSLIIDRFDKPIFFSNMGKSYKIKEGSSLTQAVMPLVFKVRSQMSRSRFQENPEGPRVSSWNTLSSSSSFGFIEWKGRPYFVGAVAVRPNSMDIKMPLSAPPIIISLMRFDAQTTRDMADSYSLDQLKLIPYGERHGSAYIDILDIRSKPVSTLTWRSSRPGTQLLQRAAIPGSLSALAIALLAWIMVRYVGKSAAALLESEAQATRMALHDALTGLPNRVLLNTQLQQVVSTRRSSESMGALLCLDLDRFKEINDVYGHHVGDLAVREVALRLVDQCRQEDTIARLGGDEFAILLSGRASAEDIHTVCNRILSVFNAPVNIAGIEIFVRASVGVVLFGTEVIEPGEMMRQADIALYRAKALGRGQFIVFDPSLDMNVRVRQELEQDIRHALENDNFELLYQPQLAVNTASIKGVEALIRMNHAVRGTVSPNEFIPIAEETGLIHAIGAWVLRQACQDAKNWPDLIVSVNISPSQLRHPGFVSLVEEVLSQTGFNPTRLEFEITENILIHDTPELQQKLHLLRSIGIRLALDDFGTGYSSFNYLDRFNFDRIKIDQSFVRDLDTSLHAQGIIRSVIGLGHSIGISIIVEGIETHDQLQIVRGMGCDEVQGFYYFEPMSSMEINEIVNSREKITS